MLSFIPVIVSALTKAFTIASSATSAVALNNGSIKLSFSDSWFFTLTFLSEESSILAVEKAMKISPDPLYPYPPTLASPAVTLLATRFS